MPVSVARVHLSSQSEDGVQGLKLLEAYRSSLVATDSIVLEDGTEWPNCLSSLRRLLKNQPALPVPHEPEIHMLLTQRATRRVVWPASLGSLVLQYNCVVEQLLLARVTRVMA